MRWVKNWIVGVLFVILFVGSVLAGDREKAFDALENDDFATAISIYPEIVDELIFFADDGDVVAQYTLGLLYSNDYGVEKDYKLSAMWYRKAAELGFGPAQNNLGVLHSIGLGVLKDVRVAYMWYSMAAVEGVDLGKKNRDELEWFLNGFELNEAKEMARRCLEQNYKDC